MTGLQALAGSSCLGPWKRGLLHRDWTAAKLPQRTMEDAVFSDGEARGAGACRSPEGQAGHQERASRCPALPRAWVRAPPPRTSSRSWSVLRPGAAGWKEVTPVGHCH